MTATEVISLAREGELKTLAVKDDLDAVIGFINLGLIELYKRFPIEVDEYLITLDPSQTIYDLPNDCMWLVAAYGEVPAGSTEEVNQLQINDEENPLSINTVAWNKVQIPLSITGDTVSIIYVSSPTLVTSATLDIDLPIPSQMIEALLNYIGYRGHGSVNGNIQAESNTHYQRFEASIKRIKNLGMFTSESVNMDGRISDRGFV